MVLKMVLPKPGLGPYCRDFLPSDYQHYLEHSIHLLVGGGLRSCWYPRNHRPESCGAHQARDLVLLVVVGCRPKVADEVG